VTTVRRASRISCATTTACCHTVVSDAGAADAGQTHGHALTVVPASENAVFPSMFPPPKSEKTGVGRNSLRSIPLPSSRSDAASRVSEVPAETGKMRPGRFELPRSKRTTRPSTLRATCPMRPHAFETPIRSARLDDLDLVDGAVVVTVLSRLRRQDRSVRRTRTGAAARRSACARPVVPPRRSRRAAAPRLWGRPR
jgi:hypothetical protein